MFKSFSKRISGAIARSRGDMDTPWSRLVGWFEFYFADHHVFRAIYLNTHRVADGVWRSAQPGPGQIADLVRRHGIRTIVNLRAERDCASYLLEEAACAKAGVTLVNFGIASRDLHSPQRYAQAREMFETIEYPILMHCKSGADRVGFMAAFYLLVHEGRPVEEAMRQLSLRYGHVRQGKTGILDMFFERYAAYHARTGKDLFAFLDEEYHRRTFREGFRAAWWANVLVDRILRRE